MSTTDVAEANENENGMPECTPTKKIKVDEQEVIPSIPVEDASQISHSMQDLQNNDILHERSNGDTASKTVNNTVMSENRSAQPAVNDADLLGPGEKAHVFEDILIESSKENKIGLLAWTQVFSESETFEMVCPKKLDKILQEAKTLESSLLHNKEMLKTRLRALTNALKVE